MIDLNFTNPQEQNHLRKERIIQYTRDIALLTAITTIIISTMLSVGKKELEKNMKSITNQETSISIANDEINTLVKNLNATINNIYEIQEKFYPISNILIHITDVIPKGNLLTGLSFTTNNRTVELTGVSDTREQFLEMKEVFDNLPYVENVSMPISNLLSKKNINFQITLTLKLQS